MTSLERNRHAWVRGSEEEEGEKEGEDMTLYLYESLKAVGLQRHYDRFTSMGVRRAAHLSELTMEDYPILGIHSMEDRTRLFHLVQQVKTINLQGNGYGDDDAAGSDEEDAAKYGFTYDGDDARGGHEEDAYDNDEENEATVSRLDAATSSRPSTVCRRLDFSCETVDRHLKHVQRPVGASHNSGRNVESVQGKRSDKHMQLDFDTECKRSYRDLKPGVHHHTSDHHTGANTKPDIMRQLPICSSQTRSSPKHNVSGHKLHPRHTTAASKRYSNKPVPHKERMVVSRWAKPDTGIENNWTSKNTSKPTPVYESKRTAGYNYGLPLSSPPAPNKKQAGDQRISVCVRKRPLTHAENRRGEADVVTTQDRECVMVNESKEAVDLAQYILQHKFYFDQVFGEESSNEEVYQRTAYPLVQHMLNGDKATCFAYGQTGAGKTHTMLGLSPRRPGLYALAARDIFAHLSSLQTPSLLMVFVSFFEIYCGQLYDLLDHRKRLFAREDGQRIVHIAGLTEVRVESVNSLLEVISWGTEQRTQGVSGVNPLSSRSHALLQIQLRSPEQQKAGRMWFVDLAGSERAVDTKEPDRQSRMEGAEINQSLLALKECIRSLDREQSHTPFRQSKLTQVLKDSFVGNSKTCMIANISPGHLATEHTLNTLRYADRVKELRGQGGARGRRRGKRTPSPKRNQSSSRGGSSTRGKSPPKKPKLGRQRQGPGPTTPTRRVPTRGVILCSTPKSSSGEEERIRGGREGIGLEHITPVRGSLGTGDRRQRKDAATFEHRRREDEEGYDSIESTGHTNRDQSSGAGLVMRQPMEERGHYWDMIKGGVACAAELSLAQRETGFCHRDAARQQNTCKGEREGERREQRRQLERNRETYGERDLQRSGEKDEQRERHLRWYHQQLQQFLPSSTFPSVQLFHSPSVHPSFSSSNQSSLSACPSSPPSSHPSVSPIICHGMDGVIDAYRASVDVKADVNKGQLHCGEIHSLSTKISQGYNNNNDEEWRVPMEEIERGSGEDSGKREERSLLEAAGEGGRGGEWRPTGMNGGWRRRAWVVPAETEEVHRTAGAMLSRGEVLVSSNHYSEERWRPVEAGEEVMDASECSNEEEEGGVGSYSLLSTHCNSDSDNNSLFHHLQVQPHHQAPAEQPLSPDTLPTPVKLNDLSFESKDTNQISCVLPLPLRNLNPVQRESASLTADFSVTRDISNPLSAPPSLLNSFAQTGSKMPSTKALNKYSKDPVILSTALHFASLPRTQFHNHSEVKAKTSVLPPDESSGDALSCTMDPLSLSLLQVDRQAATTSFLQGEQSIILPCALEKEQGEDKRREMKEEKLLYTEMERKGVEDKEGGCGLSLLELAEVKNYSEITSKTTEQNKHTCGGAHRLCRTDIMKPSVPVVTLSLQDQGNSQKPRAQPGSEILGNIKPASPLIPCPHTPTQASLIQSAPPPSQSHSIGSNYFDCAHSSLGVNSSTASNSPESTSKQHKRPTIHLSTPEDLDHAQWCVVQAHWEQLKEMEALCRKEGTLLCQQPDMAFGEYVHRLEEIMERKAWCVQSMRCQLQPYLRPSPSNHQHRHGEDKYHPPTQINRVNEQRFQQF